MPPPASVMGIPIRSSCRAVLPQPSGTPLPLPPLRRRSVHSRNSSPSTEPQVTPAMAPAAPVSGDAPPCSKKAHRPSPITSLQADSMIWLTAVGVMSPMPWVYPRMAETRHTHSTEGDSTRITPAAALSCSSPAMASGNRNITAEKTRPATPSSSSAV